MPSPFPGMDPYLEDVALWSDFLASFLPALRRALRKSLPPTYVATLDERVYVETTEGGRVVRPDVAVVKGEAPPASTSDARSTSERGGSTGTLLLRTLVTAEVREVLLEVRVASTGELVTVIELLSPSNKRAGSEGRATYLRKRNEILQSPAHLVEIDLLRGGERVPMADPLPDCHYVVLVSRAQERPVCSVSALTVAEPLPSLGVPLRDPDPDVPVRLQSVLDEVYEEAGYADRIDYGADPPPPSGAELVATVRGLLRR